jgi:hypothetical protein
MSFQDNKFPIVLGAVTAVVTGGLLFWSMKSGSNYEAAKADFDDADGRIASLMSGAIDPTDDNLAGKKQAVQNYTEEVAKLQAAFDPLRRPTLENIAPSAYTDELLAARKRVLDAFEQAGTTELPASFFLGHDRYKDSPPLQKDTGVLKFELEAFEDLFTKLAKARPVALRNVFWPGMPEADKDATVVAHPIEITFTGSETSLRDFLASLDDGGKFYYALRVIRIHNEKQDAPNANEAKFESVEPEKPATGGGSADPFSNFVFPEDTAPAEPAAPGDPIAPAEPAAPGDGTTAPDAGTPAIEEPPAPAPEPEPAGQGRQVLVQVLGDETVTAFLRIDVLQFRQAPEL